MYNNIFFNIAPIHYKRGNTTSEGGEIYWLAVFTTFWEVSGFCPPFAPVSSIFGSKISQLRYQGPKIVE